MKVLLVAPRTNLLLADEEVQDITRTPGLIVSLLMGTVTRTELLRDIRTGQYDVLWLATHGSSEGIQLSDGMLAAADLVPLIRERFRLVVLNTCSSLQTAQLIQEEANVGVICTIADVPDVQAYAMGSLLAGHLAAGKTVAESFRLSKRGGNRLYLYLASLVIDSDVLAKVLDKVEQMGAAADRDKRWMRTALIVSLVMHPVSWVVYGWVVSMLLR
jgi:hypothetical protein